VGTCSSGLALDAGNNTILTSCPGASSSIQVGTTTVTSGTTGFALYNNAGVLGNASFTGPLQLSGGAISINATTTAHAVAVWEGTSAMTAAGPGTAGQALVSNGGSSDPTYQSGQWVLLNTLTASNSASLSDTSSITATYTEYEIVLEYIVLATASQTLQFQVQVSGTFQTTNYVSQNVAGTGSATASANITTGVLVGGTSNAPASGTGTSGRYIMSNVAQTVSGKYIYGDWINRVPLVGSSGGLYTGSGAAVTGIRLISTSGNITSGVMKIYGRVN